MKNLHGYYQQFAVKYGKNIKTDYVYEFQTIFGETFHFNKGTVCKGVILYDAGQDPMYKILLTKGLHLFEVNVEARNGIEEYPFLFPNLPIFYMWDFVSYIKNIDKDK